MIPHSALLLLLFFLCSIHSTNGTTISNCLDSHWEPLKRFLKRSSLALSRTVPTEGYYNPLDKGGKMLTKLTVTFPPNQGEPLNAIISGNSDEAVLKNQETDGGLLNYFLSFGFSTECLGQHSGDAQAADLGDGDNYKNETAVIRWNYGDAQLGTCKETIQGGNHFRYWIQNGPSGNSGAIFMATSYEMSLNLFHDIIVNGYNLGRDWMIGNITHSTIPTQNLTNGTTYTGTTSWAGYTYQSNINYVAGLLENTNFGINHNASVGVNGLNSSDGLVAVIDVKVTGKPPTKKSMAFQVSPTVWQLLAIYIVTVILSS